MPGRYPMRPTSLFDAGSVPEHSGNFSSLPNMSQHRRYRKSMIWISLLATGGGILALGSCSSPIPNRNPIGESFPVVRGESLNGDAVELPSAVSGEPAILMVGYVQGTQFDLDRWTLGFAQAEGEDQSRRGPRGSSDGSPTHSSGGRLTTACGPGFQPRTGGPSSPFMGVEADTESRNSLET